MMIMEILIALCILLTVPCSRVSIFSYYIHQVGVVVRGSALDRQIKELYAMSEANETKDGQ